MLKKYKLHQITIFRGSFSTHHLDNFCYTLNHNDIPLLCKSREMIQVHINDEEIAATLRCDQVIVFDE